MAISHTTVLNDKKCYIAINHTTVLNDKKWYMAISRTTVLDGKKWYMAISHTTVLNDKKLYMTPEAYVAYYQRYLLKSFQVLALFAKSSIIRA